MIYSVLGKKTGNFTDKKTGENITFAKLYVTFPDDTVEGECVEAVSVNPDRAKEISVGDKVRFDRNQYGKVICVELV